jgi:hypothetical protein
MQDLIFVIEQACLATSEDNEQTEGLAYVIDSGTEAE